MQSFISNQFKPYTIRPSIGRSNFQTNYASSIAQRKDFSFFSGEQHCDTPHQGPYLCMWYNKPGQLKADWVGRKRLIRSH